MLLEVQLNLSPKHTNTHLRHLTRPHPRPCPKKRWNAAVVSTMCNKLWQQPTPPTPNKEEATEIAGKCLEITRKMRGNSGKAVLQRRDRNPDATRGNSIVGYYAYSAVSPKNIIDIYYIYTIYLALQQNNELKNGKMAWQKMMSARYFIFS